MADEPGPGWWHVLVTDWVRCGSVAVDRSTGQIVTCHCMPIDKLMATKWPGHRYEVKQLARESAPTFDGDIVATSSIENADGTVDVVAGYPATPTTRP